MKTQHTKPLGFVLVEALIALIVLSVGVLAIAKLNTVLLGSSGLTKSRAEATQLAQSKAEELRNVIAEGNFNALAGGSVDDVAGINASYDIAWTVDTTAEPFTLNVQVSWLPPGVADTTDNVETVSTSTLLAWTSPATDVTTEPSSPTAHPPGKARTPGDGDVASRDTTDLTPRNDGSFIYTRNDGTKELLDAAGNVLLILDATTEIPDPQFAVISGKVFLDETASGFSLDVTCSEVLLSSVGVCLTSTKTSGSDMSSYDYSCYVGYGWYGNIGVQLGDFSYRGCPDNSNTNAKICVGDPNFSDNNTTTSPVAIEGHRRVYRGFRQAPTIRLTGVANGGQYPGDGLPVPSDLGYSVTPGTASDQFNHHFFITKSNQDCNDRMSATTNRINTFARNAGAHVAFSPDDDTDNVDWNPATWPGFPGYSGGAENNGDGGEVTGDTTCDRPITGGMVDKHGAVEWTVDSVTSACTAGGGNSSNFNCSVTAEDGATVIVRNYYIKANGTVDYDLSTSITFSCTQSMTYNFTL